MAERIRLAMQKSGRLTEACKKIFEKCGLSFLAHERQLFYSVPEMPIDLIFVRDDDISSLVSMGTCDFGIVGLNAFEETRLQEDGEKFSASIFARLGISKCRLSLAIPYDMEFSSLSDLNGLKIATSYPKIVKNFLKANNIKAETVHLSGSVEIAPNMKLADIIADIVSSGETLKQHKLKEVATLLESEAVLIASNKINNEKKAIADRFMVRVNSALRVSQKKYVVLNCHKDNLDEIAKLLPGSLSPTVIPLFNSEMISVHAVCSENRFWEVMERLKEAGASSIAVMAIEKMLD